MTDLTEAKRLVGWDQMLASGDDAVAWDWLERNGLALIAAHEAALRENEALREGLENAFRDFGHIEQEAQGIRVRIVRIAAAGRERARALLGDRS